MKLTISRRLGLLVALAILASLAVIVVQLLALRTSLTQERQFAVKSEVQTAASIVKNFAAAAERGELTVLASGPLEVFEAARPAMTTFSRAQHFLGPAEEARYAKLAIN